MVQPATVYTLYYLAYDTTTSPTMHTTRGHERRSKADDDKQRRDETSVHPSLLADHARPLWVHAWWYAHWWRAGRRVARRLIAAERCRCRRRWHRAVRRRLDRCPCRRGCHARRRPARVRVRCPRGRRCRSPHRHPPGRCVTGRRSCRGPPAGTIRRLSQSTTACGEVLCFVRVSARDNEDVAQVVTCKSTYRILKASHNSETPVTGVS
jgi:hypothetical protein